MPENCYYVGSGSIFAYGVLDAGYRYNLTDEEVTTWEAEPPSVKYVK